LHTEEIINSDSEDSDSHKNTSENKDYIKELDVIFIPLVAFDDTGHRLGMGGGFYDRTLVNFYNDPSSQTTLIGLAHDIQKTLSLPTQVWDVPLPYILTPTQLYNCI
jgi:5-formyltetrahydrofolate cyclo-ligase